MIHGFVDGAYVQGLATDDHRWPNPHGLVSAVCQTSEVVHWGNAVGKMLTRVTYYDAEPDAPANDIARGELADRDALRRAAYWRAIQRLPDTHLGFGRLRGRSGKRPRRQKGVDTLVAVDMLVGAFEHLFGLAVLCAGDADFVPVVEEVRRRGAGVVVAAEPASCSDDLRDAADRFIEVGPSRGERFYPQLAFRVA